jgi:glycerol dehydrogenase
LIIIEVDSQCALSVIYTPIGLSGISDAELLKAAEAACAEGETIHNEPIPVTPEMVFSSLKATDALGKK